MRSFVRKMVMRIENRITLLVLAFLAAAWPGGAAAADLVYRLGGMEQDTLARRLELRLDGLWNLQAGKDGEWQSVELLQRQYGRFTLQKKFALDSSMVSTFFEIDFPRLEGPCTIYLNKKIIANRPPGSAPFVVSLDRNAIYINSENELVLEFDNEPDYHKSLPLKVRNRGIPMAGQSIQGSITLRTGAAPCVAGLRLSAGTGPLIGSMPLAVRALFRLASSDTTAPISLQPLRTGLELFDSRSSELLFTSPVLPLLITSADTAVMSFTAEIPGFRYWRPEDPQRYRVRVQLYRGGEVIDRVTIPFALAQPEQWLAQGSARSFRHRAIEWIEDESVQRLPGPELQQRIRQDLTAMVELGANTVCLAGTMPDEFFMNCCDSLGLAVLMQIPAINMPPALLSNPSLRMQARNSLSHMIHAYSHHPSAAGWGMGSGYDPADVRTERFVRELAEQARAIDKRPVYAGIRGKKLAASRLPVDLLIVEVPPEELSHFVNGPWRTQSTHLLKLTSLLDLHLQSEHTAQQNQAYRLKLALQEAERRTGCAGVVVSPWRDWTSATPHTYWGSRPESRLFLAGLLDSNGQERMALQVVEASFGAKDMPEILPAESSPEDPAVFQVVGITLIVLLLFYIRRDKRMSHYIHRVFVYPHGFYTDLIENRQVNYFLTGLIGLTSFLTLGTLLASLAYFLRDNTIFDELLTWSFPGIAAKEKVLNLFWHPELLILLFTALLLTMALLQSVIFKMVILGQRRYLRFGQIVAFTFWIPANFIFALPLAVVLFRILSQSNLVTAGLIYLAIIVLWFIFRAMRGTRVILQTTPLRVLLLLLGSLFTVLLILGLYLEKSRAIMAYASYYWSLLGR